MTLTYYISSSTHKILAPWLLMTFVLYTNSLKSYSQIYEKKGVIVDYSELEKPNLKNFTGEKSRKIDSLKSSNDFLSKSPELIINRQDQLQDSLLNNKVFNKKDWDKIKDTVSLISDYNTIKKPELLADKIPNNHDSIMDFINNRKSNFKSDKGGILDSIENLKKLPAEFFQSNPTPNKNSFVSEFQNNFDVDSLKPNSENLKLPDLPSKMIGEDLFSVVDSLKDSKLKELKVKKTEKVDSLKNKHITFRKNDLLKQKLFFDGIVGMINQDQFILQLSPSLGYNISEHLSIGLGPSFLLPVSFDSLTYFSVGYRGFVRRDFLKRKAYLQLENGMNDVIYNFNSENNPTPNDHFLLIGGGGLIPAGKKYSLNIGLYYQVLGRPKSDNIFPFLIRVGLSTSK